MDSGTIGFVLVAASLVMLMTPGLAFFYGGLVGRKNVLTIMLQSFFSMGWTTMIWFLVGFSLCYSGDVMGIIGNLDMAFFEGLDPMKTIPASRNLSVTAFATYQMMFAIMTPAVITGAFTNRVRFAAYPFFLTFWLLLVYFPIVHMVWGQGILHQIGVLDFAGGIAVHSISGMAALAAVFFVGKRKYPEQGPHSIPLVALGTGLLWFGWYGFNAGSRLQVDSVTTWAFLNTDISASFAAITWFFILWFVEKKPKFTGLLTGALAGLVAITPGAGYVSSKGAALIGLAAGLVCYLAIRLKTRMGWDDTLDVWGIHGVGGILGMTLLGVFSNPAINPEAPAGLIFGNWDFFLKQVGATLACSAYAFIFTYVSLVIIDKFITRVRLDDQEQKIGLDNLMHGEQAYNTGR